MGLGTFKFQRYSPPEKASAMFCAPVAFFSAAEYLCDFCRSTEKLWNGW